MAPMIASRNMNNAQPKEKLDMHALRNVFKYCRKYKWLLITCAICSCISAVLVVIGPPRVSELFDMLNLLVSNPGAFNFDIFMQKSLILVAIYVSGFICTYAISFIMPYVTCKTTNKLRADFIAKLNRLPLNYFDTHVRGDILSLVTNDVDSINRSLNTIIKEVLNGTILIIGMSIMMLISQWCLALITIGTTLAGTFVVLLLVRFSKKRFINYQNDLGALNGHVEEIYTNHSIMRLFNGAKNEITTFKKLNNKSRKECIVSHSISSSMMPTTNFFVFLAQGLVFIVGAVLVINNFAGVTGGTIISFLLFAKLFSNPFLNFSQTLTEIQQASAASARIFTFLDVQEMDDESGKTATLTNPKGDVVFGSVHFSYVPGKEIIHGFSAKLKAGQKVAIVGPTGAGKTTLVNLLMRFYELDSGDIEIDKFSTKNIKRENVHDCFDMILQETWLFQGTVRENLVYNSKNVSDETIKKACDAVGLTHFVDALPNGYDTLLDEKIALSEGQKQQLTIARAMIKDSPLLILDEATSSVDTRTELVIQKAMDSLSKGRTSFIIAHRLSTIKNADIIFYLEKGDILECGTHKELLAKKGRYADLYNSQFEQV